LSQLQSLIDNYQHGYYADGFLDRREITTASGPFPASFSAVSAYDIHVAYEGMLFFNTSTHASLFLPTMGYRTNGSLMDCGAQSYYWAKNLMDIDTVLRLYWSTPNIPPGALMGTIPSSGYSVRCVLTLQTM